MQNVFNTTNLTVIILALVSWLGVGQFVDEAAAQNLAQGIILFATGAIAIWQNIGKNQFQAELQIVKGERDSYKNSYEKAVSRMS